MIVAGFELTTTVRKPSARSTFRAWQPAWSNSAACPITIGPEPTRQIVCRSSRLGIGGRYLVDPALEERPGVVRPRPRLRVELHGARARLRHREALDGAVVERDVSRLAALARRDREAVVLRSDEHAAARAFEHRMVGAAVAERQ